MLSARKTRYIYVFKAYFLIKLRLVYFLWKETWDFRKIRWNIFTFHDGNSKNDFRWFETYFHGGHLSFTYYLISFSAKSLMKKNHAGAFSSEILLFLYLKIVCLLWKCSKKIVILSLRRYSVEILAYTPIYRQKFHFKNLLVRELRTHGLRIMCMESVNAIEIVMLLWHFGQFTLGNCCFAYHLLWRKNSEAHADVNWIVWSAMIISQHLETSETGWFRTQTNITSMSHRIRTNRTDFVCFLASFSSLRIYCIRCLQRRRESTNLNVWCNTRTHISWMWNARDVIKLQQFLAMLKVLLYALVVPQSYANQLVDVQN